MKFIYRCYQLFIAAPILLILTIVTAFSVTIGCTLLDASWWSYYPGRWWSRAFIRVLLLPVHIRGREHMDPRQSYIIIPNHQGAFDIFLVYGFLGRHFKWMMKKELRDMPLIGKACESAGFIFVDQKGGPKALSETHARARAVLQDGMSLVVFPEGARTWDGRMRRFKRGAFQLADELQLPLLPVTINGSFDVLPRSRGMNFVTWHPLSLTIHTPIQPRGTGVEDEHAMMQQAFDVINGSLTTQPSAPPSGTYNPED
ncbi:MAG: 1-acyl-sn-glycerol-3-phosphate acyltransferase [Bacteroidaceae bacterium]|nr:1-acyl-sn-glycerol-3-phosphate acyltransferase [Bacteroidaceae bacterium]